MKKIIIIIAAVVIVLGGFLGWHLLKSNTEGDKDVEGDIKKVEAAGQEYFEADYSNGNTAESVKNLSYKLPSMFVGIESDDDSVNENLYVDKKTGTKLTIRESHNKSKSEYEKEMKDYLDGAKNVETFQVGKYTATKFQYKDGKDVTEYDFMFLAGDTFYSGYIYNNAPVEDQQEDEPESIPLTEDMLKEFDNLCNSLTIK